MPTDVVRFGELDGQELLRVTLRNARGMTAEILNYGAIIHSIRAPDRQGRMEEVTLGFDDPAQYVRANPPYLGAVCGRFANRIAKGRFALGAREYQLAVNNGPNHLHGGLRGFDKRVWSLVGRPDPSGATVRLRYVSPDGEEGYPGTLDCSVGYTLGDDHALRLDYTATTDRTTPVNLTNHVYFNLAGPQAKDILAHELALRALQFLAKDDTNIPTGEIRGVGGSALDFRRPERIGARIGAFADGYDHCFVLDPGRKDGWCARAKDPASGRVVEMFTNQPGVQLYTGYYLDGVQGRGGIPWGHFAGFALEAQQYPDSVNQRHFPSPLLHPGSVYRQQTAYRFAAE